MKLSKTILSGFLLSISFFGESHAQCEHPLFDDAIDYINANKVKAAVLNGGDFFWNRNDGKFMVPYTPGSPGSDINATTIFAGAIMLGGINADGELRTPYSTYFLAGPINDNTLTMFDDGCKNFNRIWKVTRGDVLWVKEDFEDNGAIDLPIPDAVKMWPARGNPFFEEAVGFPLPDQELAPFFDRNNNGLFEPSAGEYPVLDSALPDAVPDEMTWSVFNDCNNCFNGSYPQPVGAEVHFVAYAFNCSDGGPLNYTVFTHHKIINKSGVDYPEFRMGIWLDGDLGCYFDDYFGCDTTLNTLYFYNSDNDDNDSLCNSIMTYGIDPPVQAVTFLNQGMTNLLYYNYSGFNAPPPGTRDYTSTVQYYNYLSGLWQDGTPITYGGSGYDLFANSVHHVFPDPPTDPNGWSMVNEQLPKYDRRTIMSAGPYELLAGGHLVLDAAFSYHREPGADHLENVNVALTNVNDIQKFYDGGMSLDCPQFEFCTDDCVWPGDANGDGIAKNDDLLYIGVAMGKNANGPRRAPASHVWSPYNASDWSLFPNNPINQKHQDCNGDGLVDELDWHILEKNYGMRKPGFAPKMAEAPFAEDEIFIDLDTNEKSTKGSLLERRVKTTIFLGTEDMPIDQIYGLSFSIKYDSSVWAFFGGRFVNFFQNTFFGKEEEVMATESISFDNHFLEVSISRKDGQSLQDTFGFLGRINFVVREDARTGNPDGTDTLTFQIFDAVGVDADGNFFKLGAASESIIVKDMIYDSTLVEPVDTFKTEDPAFLVAPNPSKGSFELVFDKTTTASQISFFDFSGNNILIENIPEGANRHTIDFSGKLPPGIYFVKWVLPDGRFAVEKVVVE